MVEQGDHPQTRSVPVDLQVHLQEKVLVVPSLPTPENHLMFLSNLDQVVLYPIETVYFFPAKDSLESTIGVVERLRIALEKLLVPYYFMAGRLKLNPDKHRLELDCNNAGVLFGGASSELTLDELGDFTNPNPGYGALVLQVKDAKSLAELPLTTIQVTRFKCGGFTLGFSSNHTLLDGIAAGDFLSNYASCARGEGLTVIPKPDRTTLHARSPPQVKFEHYEYVWLPGIPFAQQDPNTATTYTELDALAAATSKGQPLEDHDYKLFHVPATLLGRLKGLGKHPGGKYCTGFEALAAHLWQCRTAAKGMDSQEFSSLLFAVDVRSRMEPPLSEGFAGNAVLSACARAKVADLLQKPLWFAVEKVQEARALITDEYVKSAVDCLEINKGVPLSTSGCYVSAWWKIPLHTLDFGWGRPTFCGPVVSTMVEFILFVSDGTPDGLLVLLAMPRQILANFDRLFLHNLHYP